MEDFESNDNKREFVGNAIYQSIEAVMPQHAGKITGMLLDENVVNFKSLLTNQQYYNEKVQEAYQLLMSQAPQQQQPMPMNQ
jgi:polyadenylate-binding protein